MGAGMGSTDASGKTVNRRAFLVSAGALAASIGLVACGTAAPTAAPPATQPPPTSPPKPAPTTAPAAPKPTAAPAAAAAPASTVPPGSKLTAAVVSTSWTVRAVQLVPAAKGWWKDYGLEVATPVVGPGNAHMAAFIGGSIDFSININTDLIARTNQQGEKIYAVAGSSNKINYVLFGASNVKTFDDLKGKTVAIEGPASSTEYLVRDLAAKHNLEPGKDFQFVTIAGTVQEREQAVLGGAAAAALGTNSDWPTLKERGLNWLGDLAEVYPDFQQAVIAARGEVMDKQPTASVALLKGLIRSYQFLLDPANEQEVLQVLEQNDVSVDEANFSELLQLQRPLWPADGSLNLKGLEVVVKREQDAKRLPDTYDWHQLMRDEPLKQAQKELGLS
jgi:ABC-type nitrate/sulfonate/bicarbonate transport system substrate-binding protein